ncbi:ATP-binding protein [Thiocapsa marina]|uniref:histidine kinase n=1 Tax=Thiocapsa marina 5811 TaxID=768671 RepID=F9UBD3_9GAMM|nr:ATP-binding protein [Thiocapsa marina]EGV18251.1 integral membrane sensor hybrid histidine kinase [Thiocapsa marina 5811]
MSPGRTGWILSFRGKTVIGIALIEIILLAILVWSSLSYLGDSSARSVAERAVGTAAQFAALAKDAVLSEDLASLETFADEVMLNEHMAYLRIVGYGNLLVQRGGPEVLLRPFEADSEQVRPTDGVFDASAPIREGEIDFGRIELGISTTGQEQLFAEARAHLLSIATIEVVLVALFSILLGTYLTRALDGLRGAAHAIIEGGPGHTVPVRGRDEIADTARAFNTMSERLRRSYTELEASRRRAEAAAEAAEAASVEATRANAAKSRFLAHMSHELRTPLNAILGTLDLAEDWTLPAEQHAQLGLARDAGRALLELINNVLDLSKIESGGMDLHPERADLGALVRAAASMVLPLAQSKDLTLEVELDPRLPHTVSVDPVRLRQVLINLAGNAVKFTDAGRVTLRVKTQCPGEPCQRVRFEVIDSGIGIPPERQARLFDEFTQVNDPLGRDRRGGTGLGLAISQRIVNLMGGSIHVDSEPGRGSCFWFELTLIPAERIVPPEPVRSAPSCRPSDQDARAALPILLVDDNQVNRMVAEATLKKAGYQVRIATNGLEALEAVCGEPVGSVLMDVSMPVMDGIEASRRIRALGGYPGRVPIIAMTAHALKEEEDRCMSAGMDDFITKPFVRANLLAVLARWHGQDTQSRRPR